MTRNIFIVVCVIAGLGCNRNSHSQVSEGPNKISSLDSLTIRGLFDFLAQVKKNDVEEVASRTFSEFDFGTMKPVESPIPSNCNSPVNVFYDKAGRVIRIVKVYHDQFAYEFRNATPGEETNGFAILFVRELASPIVSAARDLYSVVLVYKGMPFFITLHRYGMKDYTSFHDFSSIKLLDRSLNAQRVLRIREAKAASLGTFGYDGCNIVSEKTYNVTSELILTDSVKLQELLSLLTKPQPGEFVREMRVNVAEYSFLPIWTFEDKHGYIKKN